MSFRDQIRKGSTETLLLMLLIDEPMYGYQISQELSRRSDGYFETKEGLLYPTLHRMQKEGQIESEWRQPDGGRRRKYYALTDYGREQLVAQKKEWQLFMNNMQKLIAN